MILVKCASDAKRLGKAIREFNEAPHSILKDITESVQAGMLGGIYIPKSDESIRELKTFLINRGFSVLEIEHENSPALQILW